MAKKPNQRNDRKHKPSKGKPKVHNEKFGFEAMRDIIGDETKDWLSQLRRGIKRRSWRRHASLVAGVETLIDGRRDPDVPLLAVPLI